MEKKKYPIELRTKWECPEEGGASLLTMPNIPKPLHGKGMQPRTIFGPAAWERMRKRTYYLANYKCEACGKDCSTPGSCHSHEIFDIDYEAGTSKFVRCACLCVDCHVLFIHSGRARTLYKNGNPLYPASALLRGAENGFKAIYKWNKDHPDKPKLKAYATFLEYLRYDELASKMRELIDKYEIEFWEEDKSKYAEWASWRVIVGNKEYLTPYKDYQAWEEAMKEQSRADEARQIETPFGGGAYDEIEKILKEDYEKR